MGINGMTEEEREADRARIRLYDCRATIRIEEHAVQLPILGGDVRGVKLTPRLRITTKGISYLQENGMMAKTKEFLKSAIDVGGASELIPGIIKEII